MYMSLYIIFLEKYMRKPIFDLTNGFYVKNGVKNTLHVLRLHDRIIVKKLFARSIFGISHCVHVVVHHFSRTPYSKIMVSMSGVEGNTHGPP